MRYHLHDKEAAKHQRLMLHNELKEATTAEHVAGLLERLREAEAKHESASDVAPCSFCRLPMEPGEHVAIAIRTVVTTAAALPLIKDFPLGKEPHFYSCVTCAKKYGAVTQTELDSGRPDKQ